MYGESLLIILSDFLDKRRTQGIELTDELRTLAKSHQIEGIVGYQLKENYVGFQNSYYRTISEYVNRKRLLESVEDKLASSGIEYVIVKGPIVAEHYPIPAFRTMGDLDIVTCDREKAHRVLLNMGFKTDSRHYDKDWQYSNGAFEIELHDRLVYDEAINLLGSEAFFNDYTSYVNGHRLNPSFHFLYLLLHLRKHLMNRGVGIRQFMDIEVIMRNCVELDWNWINKEAETLGLKTFMGKVLEFNKFCFSYDRQSNTEPPYGLEDILKNGVFGFDNKDTESYLAANEIRNSKHPFLSSVVFALRSIFPTFKNLRNSERYAYISGKPYLLPVAWLHRIVTVLCTGKIKEGKAQVSNAFVSKDYIKARDTMFTHWGL